MKKFLVHICAAFGVRYMEHALGKGGMGLRRTPNCHHMSPCAWPARERMLSSDDPCDCDAKYLVERIVTSERENIRLNGTLCIDGLPCGLCYPLILSRVQASDIRTVLRERGKERLSISLICRVVDAVGRRAEGFGSVEIDSCVVPRVGAVRRGAEIRIVSAECARLTAFDAVLDICLRTVVTCSELLGMHDPCEPCKAFPPLYPHLRNELDCGLKSGQFY